MYEIILIWWWCLKEGRWNACLIKAPLAYIHLWNNHLNHSHVSLWVVCGSLNVKLLHFHVALLHTLHHCHLLSFISWMNLDDLFTDSCTPMNTPQTLETDIWLVVRVPVLSEQMTEVHPRVSTEGSDLRVMKAFVRVSEEQWNTEVQLKNSFFKKKAL